MTTFNVASASQLYAALNSAKGGDSILMAAGNYGNVTIDDHSYASAVTIMSSSSTSLAHMNRLLVDNVDNLILKNLDIGSAPATGEASTFIATVQNSSKVTLEGLRVHGLIDGNPRSDRSGVAIRWSDSVKIVNSKFQDLYRGAWAQRSTNVQMIGNSFTDLRLDGIAVAAVQNILIDGNKFSNFHRQLTDHSDAIQFWTTGETAASTDIVIRNNQMLQGSGTAMQGIFMRDESGGKMPFQRVLIENNLVYESGYANGIAVIGGKSVTIKGNTAISRTGDSSATKIRLENIAGGTIAKNVTDQIQKLGTLTSITYADNISLLSSPTYTAKIEDIALGSTADAEDLTLSGYGYQFPTTSTSTTSTSTTTQTSASVEKIAVASTVEEAAPITTSAPTYPSFTVDGLYTGTFSSSGWRTRSVEPQPVAAAQTSTYYGGNAFRSSYQLFHA